MARWAFVPLRIAGQLGRVIEKPSLHQRNKVLEGFLFARLTTQCDPFVLCSTPPVQRFHLAPYVEGEASKVQIDLVYLSSFPGHALGCPHSCVAVCNT
jgi:hypothetical protein